MIDASKPGIRKAALYLSTLPPSEQRRLLKELPASAATRLRPMIAAVAAKGWSDPALVRGALAGEIDDLGRSAPLSVDALVALAKALPASWTARLIAAHAGLDRSFLLALLEADGAGTVAWELEMTPELPAKLKAALLIEAANSVRAADE